MKFSQFNSIIRLTDKLSLIYNSYADSYLILSNEYLPVEDIDYIKKEYPQLYDNLLKSKSIIEDEVDELSLVKNLQESVDNNGNIYILTINPTLDCNFRCWYCYENHVSRSKIEPETLDKIKKLIHNIVGKQTTLEHFQLNFFGGEPLLQYNTVIDIITYAEEVCHSFGKKISIAFTTNGYLLNAERVQVLSEHCVNSMQITLDGNRETHNKVRFSSVRLGSYDKILENIKLLLRKNIDVILRLNYTSENIAGMSDIIDDLTDITAEARSFLTVHFFRVWQDSEGEDINEIVKDTIGKYRNAGIKAYVYPLNNVKVSCYGDKLNAAVVNYNGNVYKCTAVNFAKDTREGYVNDTGEIVWENNSYNKRKNAKFKNKACLKCRLLPICNGGCSQHALRHENEEYCIFNFNEQKKDEAILNKLDIHLKYDLNY